LQEVDYSNALLQFVGVAVDIVETPVFDSAAVVGVAIVR
jgi:hypothetical protein